jgi:hypothetical protein
MNRSTILFAALFIAASSNLALAERVTTVTRSADPNTHTVSKTATVTGVNGRTRSVVTTAGNGTATQTVTRRNGRVITRSRTRG